MSKKLAGKVALVTGGSRGIGAAIANALADDGADVAIGYSASAAKADNVVAALKKKGVRAVAFKADQAKGEEVQDLVAKVKKEFGCLDILVNNAGPLNKKWIEQVSPIAQWHVEQGGESGQWQPHVLK